MQEIKENLLILFTQNFKELILLQWSKDTGLINPKDFRESLITLNSQFDNNYQQDAHELLTFILESLHYKLNRSKNNDEDKDFYYDYINDQIGNISNSLQKTQSNLNWENHINANNSIINDHFYGLLLSSLSCKICESTNYSYEPFNHLGLSIPHQFNIMIYFLIDSEMQINFDEEINTNFFQSDFLFNEKFEDFKGSTNKDSIYKIGNCKCFKVFITINENMQFKNLINIISKKINYEIEEPIFFKVLENTVINIIDMDERCGDLYKRDYFLFLSELKVNKKIKEFSAKFKKYYEICEKKEEEKVNKISYENFNKNFPNFEDDNVMNKNSNKSINNIKRNNNFFFIFNFVSFNSKKINFSQKFNNFSYPRIFKTEETEMNEANLLLEIYKIFIYSKNIFEFNSNNKSKKNKKNSKEENLSKNNNSKKSNFDANNFNGNSATNFLHKKNNSNLSNNKGNNSKENKNLLASEISSFSFFNEIFVHKNFQFCNNAVKIKNNNPIFTYENCYEKNSKIKTTINMNSDSLITINNNNDDVNLNYSNGKEENLKINFSINNEENFDNENKEKFVKEKYICLFCCGVDDKFFICNCLNEFILENKKLFEYDILKKIKDSRQVNEIKIKENSNELNLALMENNNFQSDLIKFFSNNNENFIIKFGKIKKNFVENFYNFYYNNNNSQNNDTNSFNKFHSQSSNDYICEINLLLPEEFSLIKKTEINLCKEIWQKTNIEPAISIYDLLDYFTAEEKLKENFLCTDCLKCNQRTKKLELNKFPNILIINFKRFRYDLIQSKGRNLRRNNDAGKNQMENLYFAGEKIETKIDFPLTLNLKKFTKNSSENITYDLYSICNHEGKISGGHYKAICKDFQTGKWFEFDDKIVKPINEESIVTHKAYILFYRKNV